MTPRTLLALLLLAQAAPTAQTTITYTPTNGVPTFAVREPVLIQVSGTGPSGRVFVDPAHKPK